MLEYLDNDELKKTAALCSSRGNNFHLFKNKQLTFAVPFLI